MIIQDGTGAGYKAKVNEKYRLHTEAVTRESTTEAVFQGEAFNFNTGSMTLTSAGESAIGHFKHDGYDPFVVKEIVLTIGATTGGSGIGTARIYKNPTAGTIVTTATTIEIATNRNFSSSKAPEGDMFKGAEGLTTTGGSLFDHTSRSTFETVISFDSAEIIMMKGNSLSVTWEPPTGNTSQIVEISATGYFAGSDVFA